MDCNGGYITEDAVCQAASYVMVRLITSSEKSAVTETFAPPAAINVLPRLVGLDGARTYFERIATTYGIRELRDDVTMTYDLSHATPLESTL
jgi:hypothetical protein